MIKRHALLCLMLVLAGCNLASSDTALTPEATAEIVTILITPTSDPMAITATPSPDATVTDIPVLPTDTPTEFQTQPPTATATTPSTPTVASTPSLTPFPTVPFRFDNWQQLTLPTIIQGGVNQPYILFTNTNDQTTISNLATAQPENTTMIVYLANPDFPEQSIELLTLTATTGTQIFPAGAGTAVAYFRDDVSARGLYILNLENGLAGRVAAMDSLTQRGMFAPPQWSPDGEQLAVTLATGYDLDIFLYDRGGAGRINLTNHGAYDFFPAWSPDGRSLAFVSDRATCPSWIPGEPDACDALTDAPPIGGTVHLLNIETGEVRQISDQLVTEAPRWINNSLLVFAAGDRTDLLNPQRTLWLANIPGDTVQQIALPGDEQGIYLSDTWSPDGRRVLLQRVTADSAELLLMGFDNTLLKQGNDLLVFPRFGLHAAWSPNGDRIALGGTGGQCPYGVRVADSNFDLVSTGTPPPSMCAPEFSPDGRYIAFMGVNASPDRRNPDGRIDVYSATFNGYNQKNLTASLRGSNALIGWLGGE
jgi:Tol biopolymer transport system component